MKYAIININEIVNVINWDGNTPFQYPFEHTEIIRSDQLQIGMKFIEGMWQFEQIENNDNLDVE